MTSTVVIIYLLIAEYCVRLDTTLLGHLNHVCPVQLDLFVHLMMCPLPHVHRVPTVLAILQTVLYAMLVTHV